MPFGFDDSEDDKKWYERVADRIGGTMERLIGIRPDPEPSRPTVNAGWGSGFGFPQVGSAYGRPIRINDPNRTGYGDFSNQGVFPAGGVGSPRPGQGGVSLPPAPPVFSRYGIRITPAQWSMLNQPGVFNRLVGGGDPRAAINALPLSKPNLPLAPPVVSGPSVIRRPSNPTSWDSFGNRFGPNLSLARAAETSQPRGGSFMPTYTDLSERDPYNRLAYKFSSLAGPGGPF